MIHSEDLSSNLRRITLSGRLDFHGVDAIMEQFSTLLETAGKLVIVDLTTATLICSMGIRTLILNAKNLQQRGGKMALVVDKNTTISRTLESVGIDNLLPVFGSLSDAEHVLQG